MEINYETIRNIEKKLDSIEAWIIQQEEEKTQPRRRTK